MHSPQNILSGLRARMAAAQDAARLSTTRPLLVGASKGQAVEDIAAFLEAGLTLAGENRVQEAEAKWGGPQGLKQRYPNVGLHLIGPLQSNKAETAVRLFDVIETLDRPKLADALAEAMARQGRRVPCLIQVNTGEEPQKSGVLPHALEALLRHAREHAGLEIIGLMAVPPEGVAPAPHFAFLRERARALGLPHLSMGMSGDFERAIAFGATHVRVGSALFGARMSETA